MTISHSSFSHKSLTEVRNNINKLAEAGLLPETEIHAATAAAMGTIAAQAAMHHESSFLANGR